jgi:hypothetical protein
MTLTNEFAAANNSQKTKKPGLAAGSVFGESPKWSYNLLVVQLIELDFRHLNTFTFFI